MFFLQGDSGKGVRANGSKTIATKKLSFIAMIALSAVQSSAKKFIHNAILFIETSDIARFNQVDCLIDTPYLSIIASNRKISMKSQRFRCNSL